MEFTVYIRGHIRIIDCERSEIEQADPSVGIMNDAVIDFIAQDTTSGDYLDPEDLEAISEKDRERICHALSEELWQEPGGPEPDYREITSTTPDNGFSGEGCGTYRS